MKRIQRKRNLGFKLPPNTICIDRTSKFGNPFKVSDGLTVDQCIERFRECALNNAMVYCYFDEIQATEVFGQFQYISAHINELENYDYLACFCKEGEKCHGDVYIELLNKIK